MAESHYDIEKYLNGEMTDAERHALEKAALADAFLADALDGAEHFSDDFVADVEDLKSTIYAKSRHRHKPRIISLWNWSLGIAAGLALIAVSGIFLINRINEDRRANELAVLERRSKEELDLIRKPTSNDPLIITLPKLARSSRGDSHAAPVAVALHDRVRTSGQREVEANLTELPAITSETENSRLDSVVSSRSAEAMATVSRTRTIRGKVTSLEDGSALPGVNVILKGTSVGTVTDAMGVYKIDVPETNASLVFSFIGLESKEVAVDNTIVDVKLNEDYSQLSEVVVTGAGVEPSDHPVFEFAEPNGGRKEFQKYLEREMQYPKQALDNKVEGKVTVQFTVGVNGQVSDFKVIKGIGYGCDEELIRLIKQGPAWIPTRRNDQPLTEKVKVRLKFDLPD